MAKVKDITGMRFNRLTVLSHAGRYKDTYHATWKCQCDCGNIVVVQARHLKRSSTGSCGCLRLKDKCKNSHELNEYTKYTAPSGKTECKTCKKERAKSWREQQGSDLLEKKKKYYQENKEKVAAYYLDKYNTDINFKLKVLLRTRLNLALKNNQKAGSAVNDLGCTIDELRKHLQSKFQEGMNWDNHSQTGWHIDHITPISLYNLESPMEFALACHWTNLQPLWAPENQSKRNSI